MKISKSKDMEDIYKKKNEVLIYIIALSLVL